MQKMQSCSQYIKQDLQKTPRPSHHTRTYQDTRYRGIKMNEPRKYDMNNQEDVRRWFREMEGYFRTEDFVHQGTDRPGRKFALDAFYQLKNILVK